jgi:hypothetical protein
MRVLLLSSLVVLSVAMPMALVACSPDDDGPGGSEEDIKTARQSQEGAACSESQRCVTGLVCKAKSSGPPPGAVGMPLPSKPQSGPPPGAVGMPLQPAPKTCQQPAAGEEFGSCSSQVPCNAGLTCDFGQTSSSSGGPPPGAVGLPVPPSGPPPGAVGMPLPRTGTCKSSGSGGSSSGGPPPGAVGLPLPPG